MATKRLAFVVRSLPFKTETSRLAITHAISSQALDLYLADGDAVEPVLVFVGDGVLNCLRNQASSRHYGVTSLEQHLKNALLIDLKVLICKEDIERFGITEDMIVMDAEEFGGDTRASIASCSEIREELEAADHLQVF